MPNDLFQQIKSFLEPYLRVRSDRRTYVESALRGCPGIDGQIDWEGNTYNFTHELVTLLVDTYDTCGDTPAIVLVLQTVASKQGTNVQARARQLIAAITGENTLPRIAARYQLLEQIGDKSGQGEVYLATDTNDPEGLRVVVKRFKAHPSRDYIGRFREEVRSVRDLESHPHIINIYDYGVDGETPYLVMPVMSGSLNGRLTPGEALPADEGLVYLEQIARALDFAHDHGIVHRDLKPANFLFTPETDLLCVSDFGIARRARRERGITGTGETAATEEYAAPEQLRGEDVTPQADIYALAIIAYELLTGELPFTGSKAEMSAGHLNDPLPEHAALAPFVLDVLREGAAKQPDDRPKTASDFVNNLRDALAGKAPQAVEHYLSETLPRHILEVGSIGSLGLLDKSYISPDAEIRAQQVILPELDPVLQDDDLDLGDDFALDFGFDDDETPAPPPMELAGALHAPREHGQYSEPEYATDIRSRIKRLKRVVLLGAPGAGKTFTLARTALDYADDYRDDPANNPIPIFVPLSVYDTDEDFAAFVARRMDGLDYTDRRVVWLLDALNEMPRDKGQLKRELAFVDGLVKADTPFVLTCRVRDYEEDLRNVPELHRVDLQDLNPQQIADILTHFVGADPAAQVWQGVLYGTHRETNLLDAWQAWDGSVNGFWHRPTGYIDSSDGHGQVRRHIHSDPRKLMLLCRNPFTLVRLLVPGIRAAVKHALTKQTDLTPLLEKVLPNNRARLFEQVIDRMINAEAERKNWTENDLTAIKTALEFTASALQATQQRTEMPLTDLLNADNAPADLREHLTRGRDAGLVTLTDTAVRFNHQLYQEYFATSRLRGLLADYDARHPDWESGAALPPRDERLAELFPQWWDPEGWRVTVALLGELEGETGISRVVRWLASYAPEIAVNMLDDNNDGLRVPDLTETAVQALIDGANARTNEENPVGRAAAYRVLGHLDIDADNREGIGLDEHDLPDIYKTWCEVEAGEYRIGGDEKARSPLPEQTVEVPEGVKLAKYPVTYKQFETFVNAPDFENPEWWRDMPEDESGRNSLYEQRYKDWNHPRETVTWYKAAAYCRWLTAKYREAGIISEQEKIVLPDERVWEAAARGKSRKFYPFGREAFDRMKGNVINTGIGQTSAVGIFPDGTADCGALDMSGNVWEWCANYFEDTNQMSIYNTNSERVLRGASFRSGLTGNLRDAARLRLDPGSRNFNRGFRVLLVPIS